MKASFKFTLLALSIALSTSACHYSANTSSTDPALRDSTLRDGTQVDTEQVDTNVKGGAHMQGDGHPRG